jgi:hypothetical protein
MGVVGAGAVGGLMLGLALIGLIEYRDSSFKKEEDAARLLALPVLAVVPLMASELERVRQRRRRVFASVMTVVVLVVGSAALVFWKLFS